MLGLFKSTPPTPPLLEAVQSYLQRAPKCPMILAIEATYLPHGGRESFWYYPDGEDFDAHAALTNRVGAVTVRRCRIIASVILEALAENRFFEMADAKSECKDGLCYNITFSDRSRSHHVSGRYVYSRDQPQTRLFESLVMHFPNQHACTAPCDDAGSLAPRSPE